MTFYTDIEKRINQAIAGAVIGNSQQLGTWFKSCGCSACRRRDDGIQTPLHPAAREYAIQGEYTRRARESLRRAEIEKQRSDVQFSVQFSAVMKARRRQGLTW